MSGQYDVILVTHWLQRVHRYDTIDVLRTWREHLKDDGKLYIIVTDLMWIAETIADEWTASPQIMAALFGDKPAPHLNAFTTDMLRDAVDRADLIAKEARTGPYTLGQGEHQRIARQIMVMCEKREAGDD